MESDDSPILPMLSFPTSPTLSILEWKIPKSLGFSPHIIFCLRLCGFYPPDTSLRVQCPPTLPWTFLNKWVALEPWSPQCLIGLQGCGWSRQQDNLPVHTHKVKKRAEGRMHSQLGGVRVLGHWYALWSTDGLLGNSVSPSQIPLLVWSCSFLRQLRCKPSSQEFQAGIGTVSKLEHVHNPDTTSKTLL